MEKVIITRWHPKTGNYLKDGWAAWRNGQFLQRGWDDALRLYSYLRSHYNIQAENITTER